MRLDQVGGDDAAGNQVVLDDALEHRRVTFAIPGAFWIDDRYRTAFANARGSWPWCAGCRPGPSRPSSFSRRFRKSTQASPRSFSQHFGVV